VSILYLMGSDFFTFTATLFYGGYCSRIRALAMSSIFYLLFWAGGFLYCWLDAGLDLKLSCILLSKSLLRLPEDGFFSGGAFTRAEGDGSLMGNLSFASAGVSYCLN